MKFKCFKLTDSFIHNEISKTTAWIAMKFAIHAVVAVLGEIYPLRKGYEKFDTSARRPPLFLNYIKRNTNIIKYILFDNIYFFMVI